MKKARIAAITALALLGAACGGGDDEELSAGGSKVTSPTWQEDDSTGGTGGPAPDSCGLLDVEQISATIGREVGPGEPESSAEVGSSCRFEILTGVSTSTTYEDPAIPEPAIGSVTIGSARSSAEEFDEFEAMLGDEAEAVSGIGDDAHFWGENIVYVRVGDLGLTVRIEADGADAAGVRAAVLQLAEVGASKL